MGNWVGQTTYCPMLPSAETPHKALGWRYLLCVKVCACVYMRVRVCVSEMCASVYVGVEWVCLFMININTCYLIVIDYRGRGTDNAKWLVSA